jgi:hypothetical protein
MLLDDRQRPGVRRRHHRRQRRRATRQAGLAASLLNASQQLGGALGLAIPAAAPLPAAQRIEQLWRLWELQGGQRLATADPAHIVGVREGRVRQVLGPLRTAHRNTITDREERQVRDRCLELAVKAAGGLDCDHACSAAPCRASVAHCAATPSRSRAPAGSCASWPSRPTSSPARSGCGRPPAGWASTATP